MIGFIGVPSWVVLEGLIGPKTGGTVRVSTATGGGGSVVGQLARAEGCRTLGITGSDDKAALCVGRFGYDVAFNYKAPGWLDELDAAAPHGIDIFFDSVGGEILDSAIRRMRTAGRIVQCGTASLAQIGRAHV